MKFLLDESVEFRFHSFLQQLRHDVTSVAKDYLYGLLDEDVLEVATQEQRILITNDKDFGELIFRQHLSHSGIILLRMKGADIEAKCSRLQEVLTKYAAHLDQFLVVTAKSVRIRRTTQQAAA